MSAHIMRAAGTAAAAGALTALAAAGTGAAGAASTAPQPGPPRAVTAYVLNSDSVTPIRTDTGTAGKPIKIAVPGPPEILGAMAITPDGKTVYVANHGFDTAPADTVIPISTATSKVGKAITVGESPDAIAITPDGKTAYVVNQSGTVTPIRTATNTALKAIAPSGRAAESMISIRSSCVCPRTAFSLSNCCRVETTAIRQPASATRRRRPTAREEVYRPLDHTQEIGDWESVVTFLPPAA